MRFNVLGALTIVDGNRELPLGGIKQRATLAFLLLHNNSFVPASALIKALWPPDAPPTARKMLHNAVSGIRATLSDATGDAAFRLLTHGPGYLVQVSPDHIDLADFEVLTEQGRAELFEKGDPHRASRTLRMALDLWRGPVLADLVEAGIDWPEIAAIQSSRTSALEDRIDADLACGRHAEVISELEVSVQAEPLRERLCGQLMRALYRCGRQADALNLYHRTRIALIDQLGLDPSSELRELQHAILNHELPPEQMRATPEVRNRAEITGRAPAPVPGPFLGRDHELEMLLGQLDVVVRRRRSHLATVLGAVGIGKSRLISEFSKAVGSRQRLVRCLVGNAHPRPAEQADLSAVSEIVLAAVGAAADDGADAIGHALALAVDRLHGLGDRSGQVLAHLRAVVGLGDDRPEPAELWPSMRLFLTETAAEQPLVVVVENAHWAKAGLLGFLDDLVESADCVPLLVVVTAWPELLKQHAGWGGGKPRTYTTTLEPLANADIAALLGSLLDSPVPRFEPLDGITLPARDSLVAMACGNPLFAVEYVRMLQRVRFTTSEESQLSVTG